MPAPLTVLLIHPESHGARAIERLLLLAGYRWLLVRVNSMDEGLAALERRAYDAVVFDAAAAEGAWAQTGRRLRAAIGGNGRLVALADGPDPDDAGLVGAGIDAWFQAGQLAGRDLADALTPIERMGERAG